MYNSQRDNKYDNNNILDFNMLEQQDSYKSKRNGLIYYRHLTRHLKRAVITKDALDPKEKKKKID